MALAAGGASAIVCSSKSYKFQFQNDRSRFRSTDPSTDVAETLRSLGMKAQAAARTHLVGIDGVAGNLLSRIDCVYLQTGSHT